VYGRAVRQPKARLAESRRQSTFYAAACGGGSDRAGNVLISVKTGPASCSLEAHSRRGAAAPSRQSWHLSAPASPRPGSSRDPHEKQYTMIHPFLTASIGTRATSRHPPER